MNKVTISVADSNFLCQRLEYLARINFEIKDLKTLLKGQICCTLIFKLLLKSQIFLPSPGSTPANRSEKCKICGFIYLSFPNVKSKISGRQFLLSKNENLAPNIIDWNGLNPISWLAGYSHWILAATNLYSDKGPWTASLVPIDPDHTWA